MKMTSAECLLQYRQWPRRQRMCDCRKLDRVIGEDPRKRLSAWRKLLEGQWQTPNGLVTMTTVTQNDRKVLEWRSLYNGKMVNRLLRIRTNTDKDGTKREQFSLAGGSDDRVQLWLVHTGSSTDDKIVWRGYNSSFCRLKNKPDIEYLRVKVRTKRKTTDTCTTGHSTRAAVRTRVETTEPVTHP